MVWWLLIDEPALICALVMKAGVALDGVAMVQNSCMAVLVAEFLQSCQQTATLPERGSLAIRGKNWLRPEVSSLTWMGLLHLTPLSEKRSIIFVSGNLGSSV